MTILLVQTFLLLLGAFLLGASLACLLRRAFAGRQSEPAIVGGSPSYAAAPASQQVVHAGDADRFGRALTGGYEAAPLQPATGPVVEVQPRPPVRVSPLIEPVDPPASPVAAEPQSEPVFEPSPQPEPVAAAAPETDEQPSAGQSYTQVALAVAAGAAAAAAARGLALQEDEHAANDTEPAAAFAGARVDVDGVDLNTYTEIASGEPSGVDASDFAEVARSARPDESEARDDAAQDEDIAVADSSSGSEASDEPSYTEIALAGAGLAAAAAAAGGLDDEDDERVEAEQTASASEGETLFPDADTPPAVLAAEGDDLTRIHSIDAGVRERLNRLGVTRFSEIGAWSASDLTHFSQSLGVVPGRIEQENWVGQAQVLASAGVTDYSRWRGDERGEQAAAPADGERLHRIIGIDPESEAVLRANGVTRLTDIAAWTDDDVFLYEDALGAPGRISRENWVEQARFLTRGSGVASAIENISAPVAGAAAAAAAAVVAAVASEDHAETTETDAGAADTETFEADGDTEGSEPVVTASGPRSDAVAGLRSVRSEALRGTGSGFGTPVTGDVDDLKRIRGIGVLIEKKLHSLGVISYEQVANWTGEDIDRISQLLDFKGRIERENWIEQARILASGGQTEFSRRVDRGEV